MKPVTTSILAASLLLGSCTGAGSQSVSETETTDSVSPASVLIARLDSAVSNGKYYFGHHDDTAYGHTWRYVDGASDVKAITGEYPGLMSWDLGMIEVDSARNLDGVPFEFIAAQAAAQDARGGINAISWHPLNPMTRSNSWDVSATPLREMATNAAVRDTLVAWIDRAATFIGSLKDSQGNPLPVIFRPWHENSGSWFWWGKDHSTPEQYINLWKLTRERFDAKGINNVVWAYSPDKDLTREEYFSTYPGDEYVDILGTDIYHFDGENGVEQYRDRVKAQMPFVVEEAEKRGKIAALTETGLEGLDVADWYTRVLMPSVDSLKIAYVCVWRNAIESEKPNHFYVPYPGHKSEQDFKKFHDTSNAIFVK
ncbi:MAG: glycoside hydrolase family 26 protein [Duncaniella sp.]|nr:glycoside hydrolase family 26 protein [Duncaniella sp.]MDE6327945.1 glycoside hydrolase family 26 protein [Duncaniella sp.]MDE6358238.1 glycoside hydrolase family 26 protein [Duncaniella sp.]MDE6466731.1 glycoside hydrolase family 26 protein [Duncaniella sp.]MDE6573643.1 glycoside hydrolase family 26 protein [Duncaniella sp.]